MMDSPGFLGLLGPRGGPLPAGPASLSHYARWPFLLVGGVDSFKKPKMIPNLLWGLER